MRYREIESKLKDLKNHDELKALQDQMPQDTLVYITEYHYDPNEAEDSLMESTLEPTLDSMDITDTLASDEEFIVKGKPKAKSKAKKAKDEEEKVLEWDENIFGRWVIIV